MNSTETAPSNLTVLILFSVNLAQQMCLQWPLSLLNIWLQFHTSLIHPNLKCVLLAQSASFCLYGYARSANTILIYVNGVEHWMGGQFIVQLPIMFAIQFMNAIGHILLLERLLATLLSKTYEKIKSVYFSATWSSQLCIYCGYTAWVQVLGYSTGELKISGFIIFSAYFYAGMALAEFICIIIISGYNAKKFKSQLRVQGHHNLSERFQLKDNIRTARQLGPTFFLHFVNIMISCEFPLVISYGLISELSTVQIYSSITHILITAGNCLIEFTIISRHRILRQNAIQLINRILTKIHIKKNRIRNIGSTNTNTTTTPENKARESEQYFEILKEEWK